MKRYRHNIGDVVFCDGRAGIIVKRVPTVPYERKRQKWYGWNRNSIPQKYEEVYLLDARATPVAYGPRHDKYYMVLIGLQKRWMPESWVADYVPELSVEGERYLLSLLPNYSSWVPTRIYRHTRNKKI